MKTETIFREIDSFISVAEAFQRELSGYTFDTLSLVEYQLPFLRLDRIQNWMSDKNDSFFQFAHTINRKVEKFSETYVEFIKPTSHGAYMPAGIDADDISGLK